jgi:BASS family bile acid:Na+ symporter
MPPLNFEIYGSLYSTKQNIAIDIDFFAMLQTVAMVLIIPLILGATVTHKWPNFTKKIQQPVAGLSFIILLVFMVVAFSKNIDVFTAYYKYIIWLVLAHNGVSLVIGYLTGKIAKLPSADVKTVTIETGIQNSGLSLVLIFSLFNGNGGMALLAAWWGIWHIVSGIAISMWFRRVNV